MIEISHFRGLALILQAVLVRPLLPRLGCHGSVGELLEPIELRCAGLIFFGLRLALLRPVRHESSSSGLVLVHGKVGAARPLFSNEPLTVRPTPSCSSFRHSTLA